MGSWAVNTAAIFGGGRLDSSPKGGETTEGSKSAELPVVRFFMPAGWAFAIWGPIILGERQHTTNGRALFSAIVYKILAEVHTADDGPTVMVSYAYLARRHLCARVEIEVPCGSRGLLL